MKQAKMTLNEWRAEAKKRFGGDPNDWAFKCPSCGHVATVRQYRAAGDKENGGLAGFSCIGRLLPGESFGGKGPRDAFGKGEGPCNYAGGGLFRLNPVTVVDDDGVETTMMEFAEPNVVQRGEAV